MTSISPQVRLEFIWWIITAVVAAAILFPILNALPEYPFLWTNVIFIVVFITITRHIFLLRFSLLADQKYLKVALIFLCIPGIFLLVQEINSFQTYLDEEGPDALVRSLSRSAQQPMMTYIRSEMLLFGVGSVIACVGLMGRMVVSLWRRLNNYAD